MGLEDEMKWGSDKKHSKSFLLHFLVHIIDISLYNYSPCAQKNSLSDRAWPSVRVCSALAERRYKKSQILQSFSKLLNHFRPHMSSNCPLKTHSASLHFEFDFMPIKGQSLFLPQLVPTCPVINKPLPFSPALHLDLWFTCQKLLKHPLDICREPAWDLVSTASTRFTLHFESRNTKGRKMRRVPRQPVTGLL